MKKLPKILLLVFLLLFAVCATFYITLHEAQRFVQPVVTESPINAKTDEIMQYMDRYFVDEYDENVMADAAADAIVAASGDPWSYYVSARDRQDYENRMSNSYVGIGVTISEDAEAGGMRILLVQKGSPAEQAGIEPDDVLTHVEGKATAEIGIEKTQELVRGEPGTEVKMTFRRGETTFERSVLRAAIETDVAEAELLDGGIGYIKIANFDERCADQTIACIRKMQEQGAKALVFDVRFNGGGYKDEMVRILDVLLPEGDVFRSVDYEGREEVDRSDAEHLDLPMAVLVNADSYSAAEFFAAALQEYGVAAIVGEQTTGKGNFQSAFDLSDGSILNISIGKYYTPNGVSLSETGVAPDITVQMTDEQLMKLYYGELEHKNDPQLQEAIREVRAKIS